MLRIVLSLLFLAIATPALAQTSAELCDQYAGHPWEPGHQGRGVEWSQVLPGPAIRACREALAEAPDAPEILYRLGRTLMQIKSYEQGLALMLQSAQAGYPPAETAYGTAYMQADGVANNYRVALEWLTKASAHGHVIGTNNLAMLYDTGRGVAPDPLAARTLFTRAAEAGYPLAMYNLALGHEYPKIGEPNYAASFDWHSKAVAAGHIPAIRGVARAYDNGRGVPKDTTEALVWWLKGAEAGDPVAQSQAGIAYNAGRGTKEDLVAAEKWLRAAAEQNYSRGYFYLGQFLMQTKKGEEFYEGMRWLERAGAYGELEANIELARYYALTGDLVPARKYAQVVLNFGDNDLKRQAQELLMLIESLELQTDIRRFDGQPFKSSDEG
ncbi:hypothetical protein [Devosia sp. CN2-171]|uniref:hypothetical protein n=1 Tax=Devosia sp. CN2-171 TaxID=3400909 RepID=UPI003BF7787E